MSAAPVEPAGLQVTTIFAISPSVSGASNLKSKPAKSSIVIFWGNTFALSPSLIVALDKTLKLASALVTLIFNPLTAVSNLPVEDTVLTSRV